MEVILKVDHVSKTFTLSKKQMQLEKTKSKKKIAVNDVSFEAYKGEIFGLLGPNGAGKTTAFNLITGVYQPTEGEVVFRGNNTKGLPSFKVTQMGMARTFQNIRLFSELSVLDNVKIAYTYHVQYSLLESITRLGRYYKEEQEITEKALLHSRIIVLKDDAEVIRFTNQYAPEHLIIQTNNYDFIADQITNAGSVFMVGFR